MIHMPVRRTLRTLVVMTMILGAGRVSAAETELTQVLDAMLAYDIEPAPGFRVEVVVAPGELYDPLVMRAVDGEVWLNDDGKESGDKGSRMIAVSRDGDVRILVEADKLVPVSAGFDVAPPGFGAFGGDVFALSQPKIGDAGGLENYVIQRIDPDDDFAVSVFCTLPSIDSDRASAIGVDASFPPPGSPFGRYLYASTTLNGTIYRVGPDRSCEPFVTFDADTHGGPLYQRFAPDGESLLVTVVRGGNLRRARRSRAARRAGRPDRGTRRGGRRHDVRWSRHRASGIPAVWRPVVPRRRRALRDPRPARPATAPRRRRLPRGHGRHAAARGVRIHQSVGCAIRRRCTLGE